MDEEERNERKIFWMAAYLVALHAEIGRDAEMVNTPASRASEAATASVIEYDKFNQAEGS